MSAPPTDTKELLKRALLEIRSLKTRLAVLQEEARPAVAITGMGCRFPGGADDPASFWRLLLEGRDPVGPMPAGRRPEDGPALGGFLADVESFDAAFFEITPREAQAMDPQHRLLLETVWQALADAAIDPASLARSRTGVFVGLATTDFARRALAGGIDRFYGSGTSPAVAAGRIAYALDLKGPCLTIDTACSSSLTAAHLAVRALRAKECDLALVGGVSLMLSGELGASFAEAGMLSADGRCKSFDAAADGYGRAEGVGVLVLRRLEDAIASGDRLRAVIRGSAINQDGRSAGLTAPNGPAQVAVIQAALADAGLVPDKIDLIEAHGSGTPLGDVIEAQALASVFTGRSRPLLVGTVKSTIGHAEAAAGVAGLIKTVLALEHDTVPPNLHFHRLNPEIRPGGLDIVVPVRPVSGVARAGVSSFGFSGSNAHLILERAPVSEGAPKVPLPAPVFARERFLLPGAPSATRFLEPDDPLLAGTGGLAHLGVLMRLLHPLRTLEALRFERPLQVHQRCEIRRREVQGEIWLESRAVSDLAWTLHLAARPVPQRMPAPALLAESPGETLGADQLYERIEAAGFSYGAQARCLVSVERGEAGARGRLASGLTLADPGVIEAAAQLLYALVPDTEQRPPMLAGCAALTCARPDALAASVWIRLRDLGPQGSITADLGVLAADGQPLASIDSARFARRPAYLERFGHEILWKNLTVPQEVGAPTAVLGSTTLPWPGFATIEEARAMLCGAPDPLLLLIVPDADPLSVTTWLTQAVRALHDTPCRLLLATQGAVATGHGVEWPASPGAAAAWGLAQALMGEQPKRGCRLVDLDPVRLLAAQAEFLALECAASDAREVAWRGGRRLARRLGRIAPAPAQPPGRAVLRKAGSPPEIAWEPLPPNPELPDGHVAVEVVAAGLNFRDRLVALGLRPADTPLGADLAGIVQRVARDVRGLAPGDKVIALTQPALADLVVVPAGLVRLAPVGDLVAAATMPLAYATALAGIGQGATDGAILVHQAAGATGLAAIEVALAADMTVRATASAAKQPFLAARGVAQIADSRAPATWAAMEPDELAFGAFGPSLANEVSAVRVVDLTGEGAVGFDLDAQPCAERAACLARLDAFPPLPVRAVGREELQEALATVGEGIGRTVLVLREPPRVRIEQDATYLVTGAAGALGQRVARWLSGQGAASILMLDLAEPAPVPGCTAVQADITDEAGMAALFRRIDAGRHPLRGIFHAAALMDDGLLPELGPERLAAVLAAKAEGARILHRLTLERRARTRRLDHFVLFSSIVSLLPSAGQGAYAAANAVLDRLAQERRALGLSGLSLNLGPIDAGIGRKMGERAHLVWEQHGIGLLDPDGLVAALPELLASPQAQRAIIDIDWTVYGDGAVYGDRTACVRVPDPEPVAPAAKLDLPGLQALLAPIVGTARPDSLDPDLPLLSLGIDSLMAVEFAQAVGRALGRSVPRTFVYSHPTLRAAADALACLPAAASAPPGPPAGAVPELSLLAPCWVPAKAGPAAPSGWQVLGEGILACRLRQLLPLGDQLLDLRPLDGRSQGENPRRQRLLEAFLGELRPRLGTSGQLAWICHADDPATDLLDGLIATVLAEYPQLRPRRILLAADLADPAEAICAELGGLANEPLVLLDQEGRRVRRFQEAGTGQRIAPIRGDASYLLTGGTGGIGRIVAGDLLKAGAGRVVLASRSAAWPEGLEGDRLDIRSCDLADEEAVARLIADLAQGDLPLRGVFHLAGVTADGLLATQDAAAMAKAFAAKVDGAWFLDRATRQRPLDHFVLFGSLTSIIGLAGAGAYAAANAALPGIARDRQQAGLPGLAIAWGAWEGVGMAKAGTHWQEGSLPAYPAAAACSALRRCLATTGPFVAVVPRTGTKSVLLPSRMF